MTAKLLKTEEVPIRDIDISNRLRPVTEDAVTALQSSIEEIGLQSEIHVRQVRHQGNRLRLISGARRIQAVSCIGATSIMAKVWDCTDDWARMAEIDDNLAQTDLSALDLAVFLAERKAIYERLHPETKNGGIRGNQYTGGRQNDKMSFCQNVAANRDISQRQVERLVSVGKVLDAGMIKALRAAPQKVKLSDLQIIAKCGDPKIRLAVCAALSQGTAKSAKEAIKQELATHRPGNVAQEPADIQARKLADLFARASKEGQRRFVRDHRDVLLQLLGQMETKPAEIVPFISRQRRG
ncbi:MAG: ParB N-terminal domain-containing protein [Pseudomonadota bacterium]